jgi:hypothetical protein
MKWLVIIGGAAVALYGLHRLALWAEGRGWIYYRTNRMPPGAGGMAMMEVGQIIEPEFEHVIEEMRGEQARGSTVDLELDDEPPQP